MFQFSIALFVLLTELYNFRYNSKPEIWTIQGISTGLVSGIFYVTSKTSAEILVGWLVVLRLNVPFNNFSVMSGRSHHFLGN